ncbi:MAG: argininosuccinate lyase [Elusimicrobia bacterium]|nr:argininosuccinate lyase [Elusimicrobiota bacterium]
MKKLWGGRFKGSTNKQCEDYTASIQVDKRLYAYDIAGSLAHATMLARSHIISLRDASKIVAGLKVILKEIETKKFVFEQSDEDIHMAIEKKLIAKIGPVGEKLHTARSRNDQVLLDVRLFLRDETEDIIQRISQLQKILLTVAEKNIKVVMPGYTHMQQAQPILFSHYVLAYYFMLKRDKERFAQCLVRTNVLPLGVGALAGVNYPIKREFTAKLLKFPKVSENSVDTVSDRDFIIEFLAASSVLIMHLSRLAEELVLWSSSEFEFVELADAFCTGSSIMPQKKNPDVAELIRGKSGKIYGNLMALLTLLKGLPLSYNRDLQEDKEPLFATVDTVKDTLSITGELVKSMKVQAKNMAHKMAKGLMEATDIADYLVLKGLPFRQSHFIVGSLVKYCLERQKDFHALKLTEYRRFSPKFSQDIFPFIKIENCLNRKKSTGGTAPQKVLASIKKEQKDF